MEGSNLLLAGVLFLFAAVVAVPRRRHAGQPEHQRAGQGIRQEQAPGAAALRAQPATVRADRRPVRPDAGPAGGLAKHPASTKRKLKAGGCGAANAA